MGERSHSGAPAPVDVESVVDELTLLRRIVHSVPGMLAYWGRDQRCRFANRAYETWFGVTSDSVVGMTLEELLGPIYPLNLPYVEGVLRGETQSFEREIPVPRGGPPRHTKVEYIPHVVDGVVQGFVVTVTDISRRRMLEAQLERRAAEIEDLYEHAPCGYHSIDAEGRVCRVNQTELRWLGHDAPDLLGHDFSSWVAEGSRDAYAAALEQIRAVGRCDVELDLVRKDGTRLHVLASGSPVRDDRGSLERIRMSLVDMTEIAQARADRERVIEELQDALGNVKTLSGLLPICAWCKNVRSDEGYYQEIEAYVSARTDARFTHGICPDCAARMDHSDESEPP